MWHVSFYYICCSLIYIQGKMHESSAFLLLGMYLFGVCVTLRWQENNSIQPWQLWNSNREDHG